MGLANDIMSDIEYAYIAFIIGINFLYSIIGKTQFLGKCHRF